MATDVVCCRYKWGKYSPVLPTSKTDQSTAPVSLTANQPVQNGSGDTQSSSTTLLLQPQT